MKKNKILGKTIFDYREFFQNQDVDNFKESINKFYRENKDLSDQDFFLKFNEEFPSIKILHNSLSRSHLSKISSNVKTIKNIVVIYFVLSIIGAIVLISQMGI